MTASNTKLKRKRQTKAQKELAYRYKCAWNYLFKRASNWIQKAVIDDPEGRQAKELAHEVAMLAESNRRVPPCEND